jgi:hypothetical protein
MIFFKSARSDVKIRQKPPETINQIRQNPPETINQIRQKLGVFIPFFTRWG